MRCTVTVQGCQVTFESPYADDEAVRILRSQVARGRVMSSFANDLLQKIEEGKRLSRRQLDWVHKLALAAEVRHRNRTVVEITGQSRIPGSRRSTYS